MVESTFFHKIGLAALDNLDLDHILDTLGEQVFNKRIFVSLMIAIVNERERKLCVVREWVADKIDYSKPIKHNRTVDPVYDLDGENITCVTARSGQLQVIRLGQMFRPTHYSRPRRIRTYEGRPHFILHTHQTRQSSAGRNRDWQCSKTHG